MRAATEAEALGFDSVYLHDHVMWSSAMHRHHISSGAHEALMDDQTADFYESLTTMAYLAARTERVLIGVACLVMPTRNPPGRGAGRPAAGRPPTRSMRSSVSWSPSGRATVPTPRRAAGCW